MRAMLVLSLLALGACSKGTYIVVEIEANASVMTTAINATLTNGGQVATAHFDRGGAAFGFPQSFYVKIEEERQGEVIVEMEVKTVSGDLLPGSGTVEIVPHGVARMVVQLHGAIIGDAGVLPDGNRSVDMLAPLTLNFAANEQWSVAAGAGSIALGDINRDGKVDFVVAARDRTIVPFVQVSAIKFLQQPSTAIPGDSWDLKLADIDSDGKLDAVSSIFFGDQIVVARGDGFGGFSMPSMTPCASRPTFMTLGDIDQDGRLDAVVSTNFPVSFNVLRGLGNGAFETARGYGTAGGMVDVGDMNKDGKLDVLVANGMEATVTVYLNSGGGELVAGATHVAGATALRPRIVDLDLDGHLDGVVFDMKSGSFTVLHGDGTGRFDSSRTYPGAQSTFASVIADFNLDGWPDIALVDNARNAVTINTGGPGGMFTTSISIPVNAQPVWAETADFNRDGLPDLIVTSGGQNSIQILLNISQ